MGRRIDLAAIEGALDHRFGDKSLPAQALVHRSATSQRARESYERLEFLGDRVVGLLVADMLYQRYPNEAEGALARRHAALVRRDALARVAEEIGLGAHLVMSKGEEDAGGRSNPALLSDVCEALIGALYLDGGLEAARRFVERHWPAMMEEAVAPPKDAKTTLQEWAQRRGRPLPKYETVAAEGPDHNPMFRVRVTVEGLPPAMATGPSKRAAAQAAAQTLLEKVSE